MHTNHRPQIPLLTLMVCAIAYNGIYGMPGFVRDTNRSAPGRLATPGDPQTCLAPGGA